MKVKDKIYMSYEEFIENGAITIVAFGDSVTQGAGDNGINYDATYWNRLKNKILAIKDYVPVNIINSGIGGVSATTSLPRVDSQVVRYNPDLIIVCFGLNDVHGPLDEYLGSMRTIFEKSLKCGAEVIFMTPNMFNTYVADDTNPELVHIAEACAKIQNSGKMDMYMDRAKALAEEMGVTICDCYSMWKELSKTQDVTMLLSNRINHPTEAMHELFADALFKTIFKDSDVSHIENDENLMYKGEV